MDDKRPQRHDDDHMKSKSQRWSKGAENWVVAPNTNSVFVITKQVWEQSSTERPFAWKKKKTVLQILESWKREIVRKIKKERTCAAFHSGAALAESDARWTHPTQPEDYPERCTTKKLWRETRLGPKHERRMQLLLSGNIHNASFLERMPTKGDRRKGKQPLVLQNTWRSFSRNKTQL